MDTKDKSQENKPPPAGGQAPQEGMPKEDMLQEEVPKMDSHKKNPNPRANENLPADVQEDLNDATKEQGPGTEITDGEDG